MGQLTEYELKVLTLIAETIGYKIFGIEDGAKEKDKLAYSTCLNDKEKEKYTKQAIKKLQVSFKNCVPEVAPYITAFINVHPSDKSSYDERKETIISNFFLHEYSAVIELLAELKPRDIEDAITIDIEHYIHYLGLNTIALEDFIVQFANAERYIVLASLLERINDEAPEVLRNLETQVVEFKKMVEETDIHLIKVKLDIYLTSKNDLKAIDSTVDKIISEYYYKFNEIRNELITKLDILKTKSQKEYLNGIACVYRAVIKLYYEERYNSEDTYYSIHDERHKHVDFYCILGLHVVLRKMFKEIIDEILINRTNEFDKAFDLPSSFNDTKNYINKGLYEIELLMDGKINQVSYYNIPRAIEKFNSLRFKYENNPKQSLLLLHKYYDAINSLNNKIDQGEFDNVDAHDDENFTSMWNQLCYFTSDILNLFTPSEIAESAPENLKILDILNTDESAIDKPIPKAIKKETSIHIAFTYSKKLPKDKNNLTEFRKSLIEGGFIDKSTKLTDFNKVFKNERITVPIRWSGNLSELYYLIKTLHNDKKLIDNTGKEVWKITANCFVDANGNQFDWAKFRGQKIPVSSRKLDKIISVL